MLETVIASWESLPPKGTCDPLGTDKYHTPDKIRPWVPLRLNSGIHEETRNPKLASPNAPRNQEP